MVWRDLAIDALKKYLGQKVSLENLADRIKELNSSLTSCGGMSDKVPVKGGCSKIENKWLNIIAERDELQEIYLSTERQVKRVERALSVLTDEQRLILDAFYINRSRDCVEDLCESLCVERAQIYRVKNRCLERFTVAMYGEAVA